MIVYLAGQEHDSNLLKLSVKDDAVGKAAIGEFSRVSSGMDNRDWSWFIQEDGELTYNGETIAVKRGDLVVTVYADLEKQGATRKVFIIPAQEWFEHNQEYYKIRDSRNTDLHLSGCSEINTINAQA